MSEDGDALRLRLRAAEAALVALRAPLPDGCALVPVLACLACGGVQLDAEEHRQGSPMRWMRCRACGERRKVPVGVGAVRVRLHGNPCVVS